MYICCWWLLKHVKFISRLVGHSVSFIPLSTLVAKNLINFIQNPLSQYRLSVRTLKWVLLTLVVYTVIQPHFIRLIQSVLFHCTIFLNQGSQTFPFTLLNFNPICQPHRCHGCHLRRKRVQKVCRELQTPPGELSLWHSPHTMQTPPSFPWELEDGLLWRSAGKISWLHVFYFGWLW